MSETTVGRHPSCFLPGLLGRTLNHAMRQVLKCEENQLSDLPAEIGQLRQLVTLEAFKNNISRLPPEIANLTALQHLNLFNCQLTRRASWCRHLSAAPALNRRRCCCCCCCCCGSPEAAVEPDFSPRAQRRRQQATGAARPLPAPQPAAIGGVLEQSGGTA
jgi:hypothetical protein